MSKIIANKKNRGEDNISPSTPLKMCPLPSFIASSPHEHSSHSTKHAAAGGSNGEVRLAPLFQKGYNEVVVPHACGSIEDMAGKLERWREFARSLLSSDISGASRLVLGTGRAPEASWTARDFRAATLRSRGRPLFKLLWNNSCRKLAA